MDGTYFLGHFDPIETHYGQWINLLIRGKGQGKRSAPYTPAETLRVLCLKNKKQGIEATIAKWNKDFAPNHYMQMKSIEITTYDGHPDTTFGLSVMFDGDKLHTKLEPKPW